MFGAYRRTCGIVGGCAKAIGKDIARWLENFRPRPLVRGRPAQLAASYGSRVPDRPPSGRRLARRSRLSLHEGGFGGWVGGGS
jgi:hypothetical protein